jgi:hypothetical protein
VLAVRATGFFAEQTFIAEFELFFALRTRNSDAGHESACKFVFA